ncbi:purine phosphorylase [Microtetraspora sp. NBRC 13810]|uniref:5'-methylthioadenosine/S-adenosylhomocysteine nucleosidase family protein n=1 Tax=Microtetraspora sp. NBRC 13810 TaxID=3030990 RepID=UPI0024A5E53B|nr:5'-methylthioadenosine/S-adenosylhomocysteine nucleosidase [Microtetraspora sp. NBRC 13810]GLW12774.1 purine phosphorylase [Microtetraspora sp. NBRC 13810]
MSNTPIVILTALDLEYQAIREKLAAPRLRRHPQGTRFEVGRLVDGRARVALAHVGKGNHSAAVLAERAIAVFKPAALLFVGVAGALHSHIALGDVVMATHVYAFHGGTSQDDGFMGRPRVWETSHVADQIARHISRSRSWIRDLPADRPVPEVHFGPIAAGEVVLNSRVSAHARWIREHYNDAVAIEMEGAGVAQAGQLNRALPVVVVRGISDRADGSKEVTDREAWQPRAVANAAAFAAALAEGLATDEQHGEPMATEPMGSSRMHETTHNVAKDNARVGVQAGTVYGGIRSTSGPGQPVDLAEALAGFRARMQRARAAGRLDEDTYSAAEAELAVAEEALQSDTPQSRSTLTLALKKVRGLIADVAELAANLSIVIALAQGLS